MSDNKLVKLYLEEGESGCFATVFFGKHGERLSLTREEFQTLQHEKFSERLDQVVESLKRRALFPT